MDIEIGIFTVVLHVVMVAANQKGDDGHRLRCYMCGQGGFPSCKYFNKSNGMFISHCPSNLKGCLKGWVNGSGGDNQNINLTYSMIRSCTPVSDNICLKQNAGNF